MSSVKAMVALIIAVLVFASLNAKRTPVPVEITQPEQSPYAVFYVVCGVLQHVLVTTNPPSLRDMAETGSQEMLDLIKATPLEQVIELNYTGPECFYPKEPIL